MYLSIYDVIQNATRTLCSDHAVIHPERYQNTMPYSNHAVTQNANTLSPRTRIRCHPERYQNTMPYSNHAVTQNAITLSPRTLPEHYALLQPCCHPERYHVITQNATRTLCSTPSNHAIHEYTHYQSTKLIRRYVRSPCLQEFKLKSKRNRTFVYYTYVFTMYISLIRPQLLGINSPFLSATLLLSALLNPL